MERQGVRVLIAIGANLVSCDAATGGKVSPAVTCEAAVAALREVAGLRVEMVSPWYESEAIPPSGQPPYINGVVLGKSQLSSEALLECLHGIEARFGRVRTVRNAARTLDLDLIDVEGCVRVVGTPPLLPHPRAAERAFVLLPLRDVCPGWTHPVSGEPVEELIRRLPPQVIRQMPERPFPSDT